MYNVEVGGQFTNSAMGYVIIVGVVLVIFIAAAIIARSLHPPAKWDRRTPELDPSKWRRPEGWRP
jgi:hypothetical protein